MAFNFAGEKLYPSSSNYPLRGSRNGAPQQHWYENTFARCSSSEINDKTNCGSAGGGCNIQSVGGGSGANAPVLSADQVELPEFNFAGENTSSSNHILRGSRDRAPQQHRYQNTLARCSSLEIYDKTNGGSVGGSCNIQSVGDGSGANAPVLSAERVETANRDPEELKRKAQNKISAEKSRHKRKQNLEEAEKNVKDLQEEKSLITSQLLFFTDQTSVLSGQVERLTDEAARWKKIALQARNRPNTNEFSMAYTPPCQLCVCSGHTAKNCPQYLVFPLEQKENVVQNALTTTTSGSPNTNSEASTSDMVEQQCSTDEEEELSVLLQQPTTEEELIRCCSLFELNGPNAADFFNGFE